MSTAKERIVKSKSAQTIMERYIDPIYEDSEIACALIEVAGRFYDELETYMADILNQSLIEKSTWGLKYWSDEYNIKISPGMTYAEVRRLLNEKRRYVAPPNETNLANYVTSQTGIPCRIIQWTGPYKFSVEFLRGNSNTPLVYRNAYKAIKESRQAHLCFDIIPATERDYVIDTSKVLYKFYNLMTGVPGLYAGVYPHPLNFARYLKESLVIEPGGKKYTDVGPYTGLRPNPVNVASFNKVDYRIDSDNSSNFEQINPFSGLVPNPVQTGIVGTIDFNIDSQSQTTPIMETEVKTYSIVNPYCGENQGDQDG